MIRILIVTPDQFLNEALARALALEDDLAVVGTISADPSEHLAESEPADIVLVHAGASSNTPQLIEDIHTALPAARVVIIHAPDFPALLLPYLQAGAVGYVHSSDPFGQLLSVIRTVNNGGAVVEPELTRILIDQMVKLNRSLSSPSLLSATDPKLTEREFEVLEAVAEGLTNAEIAEKLYIEPGTVKNHVHNILDKLEVDNRGQATIWYEQWCQHQAVIAANGETPPLAEETDRRAIMRQLGNTAHEHGIGFAVSKIEKVHDSLERAIQTLSHRLDWPVAHIYLVDEQADELISSRIWYLDPPDGFESFKLATEALQFPIDSGLPGKILDRLEPLWVPNIQDEPGFIRRSAAVADGLQSALFVPIFLENTIYGILEFFSAEPWPATDVFDETALEEVASAGGKIGEYLRDEQQASESDDRAVTATTQQD